MIGQPRLEIPASDFSPFGLNFCTKLQKKQAPMNRHSDKNDIFARTNNNHHGTVGN